MNFKNYKIGKKLFVTFGIIVSLLVVVVVVGLAALISIGDKFNTFHNNGYQITNKVMEVRMSIQSSAKNIGYSMMTSDAEETSNYIDNAKAESVTMSEGITVLEEKFAGDKSLIDSFNDAMLSIKEDREKVYELALANKNDEASELYFAKVMPGYLKANDYLTQIYDQATANADKNFNASKSSEIMAILILAALSIIALVATIYLGLFITRSLTKPINELEIAAKEMTKGNLKQQITYDAKDELGSLADSMKVTMNSMSSIVEDISYILGEMADGNFNVTTRAEDAYVGDFNPILMSMRDINTRLSDTLLQIHEASNQVAAGSSQMAESAQSLAEGATEQAGAVEELQATIEDVADQARSNAEDSMKSFEQAHAVGKEAELSSQKMKSLTVAMQSITDTSNRISEIIMDIEDIASQTNLLSLNAAIEAARAGEAGKGFAVVADQIRKLAEDSAKSAVNTKNLIETSLQEVSNGNQLTEETAVALESVISGLKDIADQVQRTRDSSESQASATTQIKTGIEQISEVVQSNSATSEEASATSEELSAQADTLNSLVGRFKLKKTS